MQLKTDSYNSHLTCEKNHVKGSQYSAIHSPSTSYRLETGDMKAKKVEGVAREQEEHDVKI